jgi:hypothetical protein
MISGTDALSGPASKPDRSKYIIDFLLYGLHYSSCLFFLLFMSLSMSVVIEHMIKKHKKMGTNVHDCLNGVPPNDDIKSNRMVKNNVRIIIIINPPNTPSNFITQNFGLSFVYPIETPQDFSNCFIENRDMFILQNKCFIQIALYIDVLSYNYIPIFSALDAVFSPVARIASESNKVLYGPGSLRQSNPPKKAYAALEKI